ncbi:MAG: hypothetical protein Q4A30_01440 [Candidatus Saccharibacteria bacterium]|nr:hypothetical protein [Candidatus Saccharibacteria bacterium]
MKTSIIRAMETIKTTNGLYGVVPDFSRAEKLITRFTTKKKNYSYLHYQMSTSPAEGDFLKVNRKGDLIEILEKRGIKDCQIITNLKKEQIIDTSSLGNIPAKMMRVLNNGRIWQFLETSNYLIVARDHSMRIYFYQISLTELVDEAVKTLDGIYHVNNQSGRYPFSGYPPVLC